MYVAHKKDSTPHSIVFIYLLKSLHWRTTGVERVLCCASSVHCEYLTAKGQFFYECPPFIAWLAIARDHVYMCVFTARE